MLIITNVLETDPNQGFVEVFEITDDGIVKYTKGNAFSEKDLGKKM